MNDLALPTPAKRIGRPFVKGNQAAVGRRGDGGATMRCVIRKATKQADVRAVYAMLAVKAKAGDMTAAKLFLAYAAGEPSQMIDLTHHAGDIDLSAQIHALWTSGEILVREMAADAALTAEGK